MAVDLYTISKLQCFEKADESTVVLYEISIKSFCLLIDVFLMTTLFLNNLSSLIKKIILIYILILRFGRCKCCVNISQSGSKSLNYFVMFNDVPDLLHVKITIVHCNKTKAWEIKNNSNSHHQLSYFSLTN